MWDKRITKNKYVCFFYSFPASASPKTGNFYYTLMCRTKCGTNNKKYTKK